jgi:hypothetical protein
MYTVTGSRLQGMSTQSWALEVDLEECRPPRGSARPPGDDQPGFVELGKGCQLPMHWSGKGEPGTGLRHFGLVGGPYGCTLNPNVGPLSIVSVDGAVAGDGLTLTVDYREPSYPPTDLGSLQQVVLKGTVDDSQRSDMICGLPEKPSNPR